MPNTLTPTNLPSLEQDEPLRVRGIDEVAAVRTDSALRAVPDIAQRLGKQLDASKSEWPPFAAEPRLDELKVR